MIIPQSQVLTDIANGQLAQVSWVIPDGTHSDHAESNDGSGPSWVASIVNAIGNSPYWANTAIIITWDDWGGWYDHVAPEGHQRRRQLGIGICLRLSRSADRGFTLRQSRLHFSRHTRLRQHPEIHRDHFQSALARLCRRSGRRPFRLLRPHPDAHHLSDRFLRRSMPPTSSTTSVRATDPDDD